MLNQNQNNLNDINNNNENFHNDLNLNLDNNFNNNNDNRDINRINDLKNIENRNNNKDNNNIKTDIFNETINPHLDKIKKLKENIRTKISLENSVGNSLFKNFNEENYLSKFSSGAVEYGLPCEVIYKRGMEVNKFFLIFKIFFRMS
jgi:hypothetical protein